MTDYEKTKAFLDDLGIEHEVNDRVMTKWVGAEKTERINITLYEGGEKVTGYSGFFTTFLFTPDGKFVEVGAWE